MFKPCVVISAVGLLLALCFSWSQNSSTIESRDLTMREMVRTFGGACMCESEKFNYDCHYDDPGCVEGVDAECPPMGYIATGVTRVVCVQGENPTHTCRQVEKRLCQWRYTMKQEEGGDNMKCINTNCVEVETGGTMCYECTQGVADPENDKWKWHYDCMGV